ncbi:hypothetical protein KQJ77_18190 [Klebsiella oxytoca]|uniref:hypothetical protein n=1 Tax=Klebsiella oxytoca TaxID=571 RepID=UPI000B9FA12D|nr:hypothetical protein [Klebsiella oxytoca]ELK5560386.1 hypothetical protein [Klebsiella oxytoca]MCY3429517.1 hypothetical protein [Klebsiella oxytoca]MDM4146684.1 hypothetical protein [Klebsiella oxytoca]MDM4197576.1 hypothetical protein [Klebsiella oxytoca]MDM4261284.1 hypothetical protein [Klebsiella oxytoca]
MVRQRANRGRAHSDHSAGIPGGGAAGTRLARATWGVLILTIRREIPGGGAVGTRLARATWGVLILTIRREIPGGVLILTVRREFPGAAR